jgi:hemerythrin-like domain-containing protein
MAQDITHVMVEEHRLILRMIDLLEKNTALMEQGIFRNWQFYLDAVDFIRNFADRYHHAKEEDVLFVELVRNGMPEKQSPIEAMLIEHDQGRTFVRALEEAAGKALAGEPGQISVIAENAKSYAELLREHIDKEDNILYPLAERILPEEVRPGMQQAYTHAGEKTPGLAEKYRRLVDHYEHQAAA